MSERWYYKLEKFVQGPATLDELAILYLEGKIGPDTRVRLGSGGDWRPAEEVLAGHDATVEIGTNEAAARLLSDAGRAALARSVDSTSTGPSALSVAVGRVCDSLGAVLGSLQEVVGKAGRMIGYRAPLSILLVVLLILAVRQLPAFDTPLGFAHAEVTQIWEQARALLERPASKAEWDQFADASAPQLHTLADELLRSKERRRTGMWGMIAGPERNSDSLARRRLIQVARYDLPAVLREGPNRIRQLERIVEANLRDAASAISSPELSAERAATAGAPFSDSSAGENLVTGIIATLNAFLVACIVVLFWWKRRSG